MRILTVSLMLVSLVTACAVNDNDDNPLDDLDGLSDAHDVEPTPLPTDCDDLISITSPRTGYEVLLPHNLETRSDAGMDYACSYGTWSQNARMLGDATGAVVLSSDGITCRFQIAIDFRTPVLGECGQRRRAAIDYYGN